MRKYKNTDMLSDIVFCEPPQITIIPETATISLDRYNEYLSYKRIIEEVDLLNRLHDIVDLDSLDLSREVDRRLFELYEDVERMSD